MATEPHGEAGRRYLSNRDPDDRAEMARRFRVICGDRVWTSLDHVALATGMSKATWSRLQSGKGAGLEAWAALASATGSTMDDLLSYPYWPTRVSTNGEHQTRRRRATDLLLAAAAG